MSPSKLHVNVIEDGLVAYARNPSGRELLPYVKLPKRLAIHRVERRFVCRFRRDSIGFEGEQFTRIPASSLAAIQRKLRQERVGLRLSIQNLTERHQWIVPEGGFQSAWLNFIFERHKAGGLIQHWDGLYGFAWRFSSLRRSMPHLRILVTAIQKSALRRLNKILESLGEQPLEIASKNATHPTGNVIAMNAELYFSRNKFVVVGSESSPGGLAAYDVVFILDPQDWLGPNHESKMRQAMMAVGSRVAIGVITLKRRTLKNELRDLRTYFGSDILAIYSVPRRKVCVWSLPNCVHANCSFEDHLEAWNQVVVNNGKRNILIRDMAINLVDGKWPFRDKAERFSVENNCVLVVAVNQKHKERLIQLLRERQFQLSAQRWCVRHRKYIKIFTLAEFHQLRQLPTNVVINTDARGRSLDFRSHLLRETASRKSPIHVVEIADQLSNEDRRWKKSYPQATQVVEVHIRPGGLKRTTRR